jgi:Mor family transcriptional regulator
MSDRRRKLTEQQVAEIRAKREQGAKMPALARQYQVSTTAIWLIIKGYGWKK